MQRQTQQTFSFPRGERPRFVRLTTHDRCLLYSDDERLLVRFAADDLDYWIGQLCRLRGIPAGDPTRAPGSATSTTERTHGNGLCQPEK